MITLNRKGGILFKLLAAVAAVLMVLAIEVPNRMWSEQEERVKLSRERMELMNDLEVVYMQETNSFSKDLKKVYEFAANYDTLKVGAPEMELEILDLDTTQIRFSFSDYKHVADLAVVDGDGNALKELPRSKVRPNEQPYTGVNSVQIELKMKDPNLNLRSNKFILTSDGNIKATAKYKGEKDIYWDFISDKNIKMEFVRLPYDVQDVNMARYIIPNFDEDKTPYLCPSTLEPFDVSFNLSAKIYMKVKFFRGEDDGKYIINGQTSPLVSNEKVSNYFLNTAKLKTELKVADFVREYEIDGDSTYSSQAAKDSLFGEFLTKYLADAAKKTAMTDSTATSIAANDTEYDEKFSPKSMFEALFSVNPGEKVKNEIKNKLENRKLLEAINFTYETGMVRVDTVSVKIDSPVKPNSNFKGIKRNFLQEKNIFGIEDDPNAGSIDNGTADWKKD